MLRVIGPFALLLLLSTACQAEEIAAGHHDRITVAAPARLDWTFVLANQSLTSPPEEWIKDYQSTEQSYECFVPDNYDAAKEWPLVLFVSPSPRSAGWTQWKKVCSEQGVIFASPHDAGNQCPFPRRTRIVLDVLGDLRNKLRIDPDRTYIGGFSGGGRVACAIGFALPEYFGGVAPVCAGGWLREESWLRQRVKDRLRIAQITGETDFNRGEVERLHQTRFATVGVPCRTWVVPKLGHGIPAAPTLHEAYAWMEEGLNERRRLAKFWPSSRIADSPSRAECADRLLAEAKGRMANPETFYSGLMQLKGVYQRWPDRNAGRSALKLLTELEQQEERPWEKEDLAEQRQFLIARARGLDAYASGPLPAQYQPQKQSILKAALESWRLLVEDGQDQAAVAEAKLRIPVLEALQSEK